MEDLQFNMKNRLEVGTVLRELRLSNIQCKFEAEQLATEQNFQVRLDDVLGRHVRLFKIMLSRSMLFTSKLLTV